MRAIRRNPKKKNDFIRLAACAYRPCRNAAKARLSGAYFARGGGGGGRPLYLLLWRFGPVGALIGRLLGILGRVGPAARGPAYWAYRPGGALFGALARAGNAAPHKKALVFFINAGKFLADGGRLALFGGHITHNARAGVCFAALRE